MQTYSLGVDIGTSSAKAAAYDDATGDCLTASSTDIDLQDDASGRAEQAPEHVYERVVEAMIQTMRKCDEMGYQISRVGLSAAMHSVLAMSDEGTAWTNALTWIDRRASTEAESLWQTEEGRQVYRDTGTPIHAMSPLVKLVWLRNHKADLKWHGGDLQTARFLSIKEYIWHRWFGVYEVDASIASATGLYNTRRGLWDESALLLAGIDASQLSDIVPTTTMRTGCRDERLLQSGLAPETPFCIGASDGVLATYGSGATASGCLSLTLGTSLAVRMAARFPVTHEAIRSFCYVLDDETFIVGGPSNSGGLVLDWLYSRALGHSHRDGENPNGLGQLLHEAGEVVTDDLTFLPYISGERAPVWSATARGSLLGLALHHDSRHIVRAAVEGIMMNAYVIAQSLMERTGLGERVVASGKLLAVPWIGQWTADLFGLPMVIEDQSDPAVYGAAQWAAMAQTGTSFAQMPREPSNPTYLPNPNPALRQQFEHFRQLVHNLSQPPIY